MQVETPFYEKLLDNVRKNLDEEEDPILRAFLEAENRSSDSTILSENKGSSSAEEMKERCAEWQRAFIPKWTEAAMREWLLTVDTSDILRSSLKTDVMMKEAIDDQERGAVKEIVGIAKRAEEICALESAIGELRQSEKEAENMSNDFEKKVKNLKMAIAENQSLSEYSEETEETVRGKTRMREAIQEEISNIRKKCSETETEISVLKRSVRELNTLSIGGSGNSMGREDGINCLCEQLAMDFGCGLTEESVNEGQLRSVVPADILHVGNTLVAEVLAEAFQLVETAVGFQVLELDEEKTQIVFDRTDGSEISLNLSFDKNMTICAAKVDAPPNEKYEEFEKSLIGLGIGASPDDVHQFDLWCSASKKRDLFTVKSLLPLLETGI